MKYLIPTEPDDMHAALVKIALEEMGHHVRLLFTADQPTKQKNSVFIDNDFYQWKSADKYESHTEHDYDVVWWRRARKPFLPKQGIHPNDFSFINRENNIFFEGLTHSVAPNAWWVNSKEASVRANWKLLQLKLAIQCGFTIPKTLFSNDPKEIRSFIANHKDTGVVYKPLCSNFWFEENHVKIAYTTKIDFLELPSNQVLQLTPGIFQTEIRKEYELRITCFGNYIVAAKLNSQCHSEGRVDWRAIIKNKMTIEPYRLPPIIEQRLKRFMRKLGIVFGSFDFIVTPEGDYIFLEVNEQGQFLWIEEYEPKFKMLDIFINFLSNRTVNFQWNEKNIIHSIDKYRKEMNDLINKNLLYHVDLNSVNHSSRREAC
ncbi:Glutathione synthase/Ribosomal protein S6 modification enzyme (glutaminyl transferase) [Legionella beliardensis]|uniref:Glutathione synthase/Ribosomal protein S6 modification enzyme (Glutaminyl transferase) n=1 Tax=Legionella beliardensis TaxID=91822 RepID=A0A378I4B3_9GAMM|nr:hypothetical protein [Legionella beliardensis]STX29682.1 Glutathione synthase/Ribosomal protein S6 modification enzyme (glutaminyl transferase) [Legionella beliardensis]